MIGRRFVMALACVGLTVGCGSAPRVDVHDERLPLEARQWVGGADDAVAIAQAGLDQAQTERDELDRWKRQVRANLARASALTAPLEALIAARDRLAERRVERARARLELARATRDLTHAQTAMRYDLAVYDLASLRTAVAASQAELERTGREVEEAVAARDEATAAFWSAYRMEVRNDPSVGALFWQ